MCWGKPAANANRRGPLADSRDRAHAGDKDGSEGTCVRECAAPWEEGGEGLEEGETGAQSPAQSIPQQQSRLPP